MSVISMKQLLEAGVHFGHQTRRWNPKMAPYIYTERNGIYIIDLQKSVGKVDEAYKAVSDIAADGGTILFVGTKKQAQDAIKTEAERCGMFYVNERWLGGMLTNFKTIQSRIARLKEIEAMSQDGTFDVLPKKEVIELKKEWDKLEKNLGGIKDMDKIIPLFIDRAMPEWFSAVFMLCILSASMSTLSAQFHTMGASFGADIFPKLGHRKNANSTMGVRIGVLCSILVSYIICYTLSAGVIARGTALFMGICAATFLPAYFCSLFWKKATKEGALASLWTGALASLFAMLFLHKAEAGAVGLCNMLSGRDVLIDIYPWFAIDPILFALPLSTVAMVLTSLITYKKQEI